MSKFWIILSHTYLIKLRSRPFIITTIISLILLIGLSNIDRIMNVFGHHKKTQVIVLDHTQHLYQPLAAIVKKSDASVKFVQSNQTVGKAKKAVQKGKYAALLILNETPDHLPSGSFYAMKITDQTLSSKIQQGLQQLKVMQATQNLGLNPDKVAKVYSPVSFNQHALDKTAKNEKQLAQARVLVYILVLLIYMTVLLYGTMIAMEIATEKSSRVMEIIVSSVPPVTHMLAKILAIGLLGLTQYALFILTGYISLKLGAQSGVAGGMNILSQIIDLHHLPVGTIVYAVIFFLLGYFFYASLLAMIGSLVSRVEDVNQSMAPITMLVVAAFMIAMFGLQNPDATFITVMSYIPFFTPMIMFLRAGMLTLPFWEIGLGILIMVISIILLLIFGTRIYKGGVLSYQSGSVIKLLKNALKMSHHAK